MFTDDELLPISALQHLLFCERQCALIHIEGLWAENRQTAEGRLLHNKAHGHDVGPRGGGMTERRATASGAGIHVVRGIALQSLRLGLTGFADVVEFHESAEPGDPRRTPFPVEYKRGRPKSHDADRVQLCAQAMCLEEMLAIDVSRGALFYGRTRRRQEVAFSPELRRLTEHTAARLHELIRTGRTPVAVREAKCDQCSLLNLCMPDVTGSKRSAARYLRTALAAALSDAGESSHEPGHAQ